MSRRRFRDALLALAALVPAGAAAQASGSDAIETAKAWIQSGDTAAAQALLDRRLAAEPRNVEILFLLGMTAIAESRHKDAIGHFRKALIHQPDATRIRLELARAFFLDKDYENSFRQFQFARAGNPPAGVIQSIEAYLAAIRQAKSWSYRFSASLAPDSNINNATSASEAEIFGLPFELSDDARRKSGVGVALEGGVEYAPRIGERTRLRLGTDVQRREYEGRTFDDTTVALHAGPRLVLDKWDLSLLATGFTRWYGSQRYNDGAGARIEATHYPDSRTMLAFGISGQHVKYRGFDGQSGPAFSAWGGAVRALSPSSSLTVKIGAGRQSTKFPEYANWSGNLGIGYSRELPGGFSAYVEPSIAVARYDDVDLLFGVKRSDNAQSVLFTLLNRHIVLERFTPRLSWTYIRRRSNIELYQFTQNRLEVGLTTNF